MSTIISEIEDDIKEIIKRAVSKIPEFKNIGIHLGTPQNFMLAFNNELPCILVSYTSTAPYEGMYPGNLIFSVYYISYRTDRETIYRLMENVFDKMQYITLESLNGALRLESDKFFYEDADLLMFVQQWTCSKLK